MNTITANGIEISYQVKGSGAPLVFIHGGFVDKQLWDPQFEHFQDGYRLLRYDLRGHGQTGESENDRYSIQLFADDLHALLMALKVKKPVICGLSLGGMIAQVYATQHPESIRGLVICDSAVSIELTLMDKLQRYVFFPKWLMQMTIRAMSVQGFTRFSFWLARKTRSADWIGRDEPTRQYVEEQMLAMNQEEYLKIYDAIYGFKMQPLERISCPTLILNGEHESKTVFRHSEEMVKRIPQAQMVTIPGAGHTSNMENAQGFNQVLESFLLTLPA